MTFLGGGGGVRDAKPYFTDRISFVTFGINIFCYKCHFSLQAHLMYYEMGRENVKTWIMLIVFKKKYLHVTRPMFFSTVKKSV